MTKTSKSLNISNLHSYRKKETAECNVYFLVIRQFLLFNKNSHIKYLTIWKFLIFLIQSLSLTQNVTKFQLIVKNKE